MVVGGDGITADTACVRGCASALGRVRVVRVERVMRVVRVRVCVWGGCKTVCA